MILPVVILVVSTALLFFYFQVVCQKILQRKFSEEYFHAIVEANRLEFPAIRNMLEEFDAPVDYAQVRMTLQCDFLALTYLAKNAANVKQRYTRDELLLIVYFRAVFAFLVIRHVLKLGEKSAVLKLTAILEWFANVVGQRVAHLRFGNLSASDFLRNL